MKWDVGKDSAYTGRMGQLKFMVHVQGTAGNAREDEIFKSERTPWKSLY